MLNEMQPDLREQIDQVRQVANYDTRVAAAVLVGTLIKVGEDASAEHRRKTHRIAHLRGKWDI